MQSGTFSAQLPLSCLIFIMSNASLQAQRAGIRESSGFSSNAPTRPGGTIPNLRPNDDAIRKLLEGKKIAQLEEKYKAVQAIFNQRPALAVALNAITQGSSSSFDAVEWGSTRGFPAKSKFNAKSLADLLCDVRNALATILPSSVHHSGLPNVLRTPLRKISEIYESARMTAATELQVQFSSQFLNITGERADRKYLQDGYKPTVPGLSDCICCDHGWCDEPNENILKAARNARKKAAYDVQAEADSAAWANGQQVLSVRGEVMTQGRKRPDPKYEQLEIHCQCRNFRCLTSDGAVPSDQCPINCIDPDTNARYKIGTDGSCLCPICSCNSCPSFFTVSICVVPCFILSLQI